MASGAVGTGEVGMEREGWDAGAVGAVGGGAESPTDDALCGWMMGPWGADSVGVDGTEVWPDPDGPVGVA